MDLDPEGGYLGEEGRKRGDKGNDDEDDTEERNTVRSFVSFPSEKGALASSSPKYL